jgi:hypothetical protein
MTQPRLAATRLALCCSACLLMPAAAPAQQKAPAHLEAARAFVQELSLDQTEYRHRNTVVRWKGIDGATGNEARTDCSGFLDALLQRTYGLTREDLKKWTGRARPLARTYYDVIEQGKGFTQVARVTDVLPGDIIAIRYPAGAGNTGHVMLVSGPPRRRAASAPLQAGTVQWQVPVIDASKSGHGKSHTRRRAEGTFAGGVGEGVFRLYADPDGRVVGYSWSTSAKSVYRGADDRPLLVGRFDPNFKP